MNHLNLIEENKQHQNPAALRYCVFPFSALDVAVLRWEWTGQGVPSAPSVLMLWFLVSSLAEIHRVWCKAAAMVQPSHSSGVSKQTLEHILRLWVYICHFFLADFHSVIVVQRSRSPWVMCLHMLIAPKLLAIQINKITTLWEKCYYFIVVS